MSVTNMDTSIKPDVKSTRSEELANPEKRISLQVKYYVTIKINNSNSTF